MAGLLSFMKVQSELLAYTKQLQSVAKTVQEMQAASAVIGIKDIPAVRELEAIRNSSVFRELETIQSSPYVKQAIAMEEVTRQANDVFAHSYIKSINSQLKSLNSLTDLAYVTLKSESYASWVPSDEIMDNVRHIAASSVEIMKDGQQEIEAAVTPIMSDLYNSDKPDIWTVLAVLIQIIAIFISRLPNEQQAQIIDQNSQAIAIEERELELAEQMQDTLEHICGTLEHIQDTLDIAKEDLQKSEAHEFQPDNKDAADQ